MASTKLHGVVYGGIIAVLVVGLLVSAWYVHTRTSNRSEAEAGTHGNLSAISAAAYTDIDGTPVSLDAYRGRVLVVNAWASWCPYCVHELPLFGDLKGEFGEQIAIVAINRAESKDTVRAFLEYVGSPRGITVFLDPEDAFYKAIGGFSMPETQVYDRAGNLISHRRGAMSFDAMRSVVMEALSK